MGFSLLGPPAVGNMWPFESKYCAVRIPWMRKCYSPSCFALPRSCRSPCHPAWIGGSLSRKGAAFGGPCDSSPNNGTESQHSPSGARRGTPDAPVVRVWLYRALRRGGPADSALAVAPLRISRLSLLKIINTKLVRAARIRPNAAREPLRLSIPLGRTLFSERDSDLPRITQNDSKCRRGAAKILARWYAFSSNLCQNVDE